MTFNYRRTSLDRDTTFYIPKVECFACYDSGIVSNGDSLINQFIPDYDRDQKGRLCGGQDLAIICHCKAAYGDSHSDNEKEKIRQIHTQRKDSWQKTAKEMNEIRNKRAKGEKVETPYYIQVVKEDLTKVGDMFSFPSEKAIVQTMTESNDQT